MNYESVLNEYELCEMPESELERLELQLMIECEARMARRDLLSFIQFVWWKPTPLVVGTHTVWICNRLTKAVDDFLAGKSSFLDIACPFRHGKSDIASRALPAFFLGRCHEVHPDVIMSGYGADLVQGFSRDVQNIMHSKAYQHLFPGVVPTSSVASGWRVAGSTGEVTAAGLGGAITGKGAHLLVVDDYTKNRAEARSETYQVRTWESFQNDLMTRRAPVSMVVLVATPWHVKDLRGKIREAEKEHENFPMFEKMVFPARPVDPKTGKWTGRYLFEERFPRDWYETQYATLGRLSAGLLDCNPTIEGGNRFPVERIRHLPLDKFPQTKLVRGWDMASSSAERDKDDPDYTAGALCGVTYDEINRPVLWIYDVQAFRYEAPERDARMRAVAAYDGLPVTVKMEAFGAYKDAYIYAKKLLTGLAVVQSSHLPGDKSAKLACLEPLFDAGNIVVPEGAPWYELFEKQFAEFPDGDHDDIPDAVVVAFDGLLKKGSSFI